MLHLRKPVFILLCLSAVLGGCNRDTVFEAKMDFTDRAWPSSRYVRFEFEIDDTTARYTMYFHIRHTNQYPFQNLYIQHYLMDSAGALLQEKLNNIVLFDPVTGVPVGSGMGDLYTVEKPFVEDFRFDHPGIYQVRMDHYMRMDTLPEIISAGYSVQKAGLD